MRSSLLGAMTAAFFLALTGSLYAQVKTEFARDKDDRTGAGDKEASATDLVGGKTLDQWMKDLQSGSPSVRETALQALPQFGLAARKAVPGVINELRDPDASVRVNAAIALGFIGLDEKDRQKGVGALKLLARDGESVARLQAIMALARIGPDARDAVSYLAQYAIYDGKSWEIRKAAALALGNIAGGSKDAPDNAKKGPETRALIALTGGMADLDKEVRLQSVLSLIKLGPPVYDVEDRSAAENAKITKQSVERALKRVVNDRYADTVLKIWAHVGLMRMDKVTKEQVTAVSQMLYHTDMTVRIQAAQALGMVGPDAEKAVPDLIKALEHKDPATRHWAAGALGAIHAAKKETVPALVHALNDSDPAVRTAAAQAIGTFGLEGKAAIPDLTKRLEKDEKEPVVAAAIIWALGEMGDAARPAIPALERVVKDEEDVLKKAAREAIDKINGKKPKPRKDRAGNP